MNIYDWHAGKAVRLMRKRSRWYMIKDAARFLWPVFLVAAFLYWRAPLNWF